jgi:hypothetical protein
MPYQAGNEKKSRSMATQARFHARAAKRVGGQDERWWAMLAGCWQVKAACGFHGGRAVTVVMMMLHEASHVGAARNMKISTIELPPRPRTSH